jgi:hypothetical protein
MDPTNEKNTRDDQHRDELCARREDRFAEALELGAEHFMRAATQVYALLEDIYRKVGQMEISLQGLEDAIGSVEATESEINTAVVSAGERFVELINELKSLPAEGGSVSAEQVQKLTDRATAAATSLQGAANQLASETPAAGDGSGGSGSGTGSEAAQGADTSAGTSADEQATGTSTESGTGAQPPASPPASGSDTGSGTPNV